MLDTRIKIHTAQDFEAMRAAGRVAAETLDFITPYVKPGAVTEELDRLCHEFMLSKNATPATLGYRGYPKSTCISVNHVICHGIPSEKALQEGDIVNIDVTPIVDGWHGDTSRMYEVGKVGVKAKKLVRVTYEAMMLGIKAVRPGATVGDIGHAIQTYVEANRFSVVVDFCGHGTGRVFHAEPSIIHAGREGTGVKLLEGMIFTVEPMVNVGRPDTLTLGDGWTVITRDRSLSAQFEHTVGVTADGVEIFTLSPKNWHYPSYEGA